MKIRRVGSVPDLGRLATGQDIPRQHLAVTNRWSILTRTALGLTEGHMELGKLCRVHHRTVTGANAVWVVGDTPPDLPDQLLFPSITRARELFKAGPDSKTRMSSAAWLICRWSLTSSMPRSTEKSTVPAQGPSQGQP